MRNWVLVRSQAAQQVVQWLARRGWLPRWLYSRLPPVGVFWLTSPNGQRFRYRAYLEDIGARDDVWTDLADLEPTTLPVFQAIAARSETVIDVGAHAGLYTLVAAVASPATHVIAVEPYDLHHGWLVGNVALNALEDRVTIVHAAASATPGVVELHVPDNAVAASLLRPDVPARVQQTQAVVLDDAVGDARVGLVKADVEGHELQVLRGLIRVLARDQPVVCVECLDRAQFAAIAEFLAGFGYDRAWWCSPDGPVEAGSHLGAPGPIPYWANFLLAAGPIPELDP